MRTTPFSSQRKQATILFVDISVPPAAAEALSEKVRERLGVIIQSYGGVINHLMEPPNDLMMVIFGVPRAREDDPERAVRAALAMVTDISLFSPPDGVPQPPIRIGISTGLVSLHPANHGTAFTAMGPAVNVASHLSEHAPPGCIVISQDTYRHVTGLFDTEPLDPLDISGLSAPVARYRVQGEYPRSSRVATRGIPGVESRMIGRDAELAYLQGAVARALAQRQLQVVTVTGEGGVGKSRLLHEFEAWLAQQPLGVRLCKGRADPQLHPQSYALVRDLFAYQFRIREGDRAVMARAKLEQGVREWLGANGIEKAHILGQLLGFNFSNSPHLKGVLSDTRQMRDRAFHYIAQFFKALATRPVGAADASLVVVLLEDIHWADDGSLNLIEHLVQTQPDVPMVLICSARPILWEHREAWGQKWPPAAHRQLTLRPLPQEAARQLVLDLLHHVEEVPTGLVELIARRADGNPFYVEELIKMLLEDGVIVRDVPHWTVAAERLAELRMPPTLTGVLQARLDSLPPLEHDLLQRAAVVGRTFWDSAILHLSNEVDSLSDVRTPLTTLQEKGLIAEQPTSAFDGTREYVFHHTLLQEVAYDSLLKRQRQWCHAQIASWLIEHSDERVAEYAGQIGRHYEAAGRRAAASEWYRWAAHRARDAHAPQTAILYYQRALPLLAATPDHAGQRIEMLESLGKMLWMQARYAEAMDAFHKMRAVAEEIGDQAAQARSWDGVALVQAEQGRHELALVSAREAAKIAREAGEGAKTELAAALIRIGNSLYRLDALPAAQRVLEQALDLSTALNERHLMARSLNILGLVHDLMSHYEAGRPYLERALAITRELDDRQRTGMILNNLGWHARAIGDHEAAIPLYREALALIQEIGDWGSESVLHNNLGGALVGAGQYEAAEASLRRAIHMRETAATHPPVESYRFLAEALLGQGRIAEAWEAAKHSLKLAQRDNNKEQLGSAWRVLGEILVARQDQAMEVPPDDPIPGDPRAYFSHSLQLLESTGSEREQALTLRAWSRYEHTHGHPAEGKTLWQKAVSLFETLGMSKELDRMRGAGPLP